MFIRSQLVTALCALTFTVYAQDAVSPTNKAQNTAQNTPAAGDKHSEATAKGALHDTPAYDNILDDKGSYYRPPMDIQMLPSANFAETRPGHLHAGVDIKTGGATGQPLYSAADGYISRVGIAPWGYGRVLYISHPNGTTTVYAHMQKFTPDVEKYIADERYRRKTHAVDFFPDASLFPLKQGQLIGYSGNSGASAGPHLHFEVRETMSQSPVNILARGYIDIKDNIPPRIVNLYYIETDTIGVVPVYSKPKLLGVRSVAPGKYTLNGLETVTVGPRGYFVIEVTDRKNDSENTMGVYGIDMSIDNEPVFSFKLDSFRFDQQRCVNSLMQYDMQIGKRNQFLRLAKQGNNHLPVFGDVRSGGLVMPSDDAAHPVVVNVYDDAGNVSTLSFNVAKRAKETQARMSADTCGIPLDCRKLFVWNQPGIEVSVPANALYESIFYRQSADSLPPLPQNVKNVPRFSPVYNIHDSKVPIHTSITLAIEPEGTIPEELRPKLCLASVSPDGQNYSSAGGKYADGRVSGTIRTFGRYCLVADTVPPVIKSSFVKGANLRNAKSVYFVLSDNFSGVGSYTATIDGKWISFEQGKGTITHTFDPSRIEYKGDRHELVITVNDACGNSTTLKTEFIK